MSDDIETGPIDYVIVVWPPGKEPNGEGLKHLVDLTDRGLVRVLDLAFVKKEEDGSVVGLAVTDIDGDGDLSSSSGARPRACSTRMTTTRPGPRSRPSSSAAILVYENAWAAPFATALRKSGAQLVAAGRIPINDLIQKLDELEAAGA
jgi:hypothetical protein